MNSLNEQKVNIDEGFSAIYSHYEQLNQNSTIDQHMRHSVYKHVAAFLNTKATILELNSGSGIDATYFAKQGHQILATDIAKSSSLFINKKIEEQRLNNLKFQSLDFEDILSLSPQKFDFIFSNFGGFNCIENPALTMTHFKQILQPNGIVTLCILCKYYPWEWMYALKGKFKLAFRRLMKGGTVASVEGKKIKINYYTPKQIKKMMGYEFQTLKVESIGFAFPSVNFQKVHNRKKLSKLLVKIDTILHEWKLAPKCLGDYFIISFKLKTN